MLCKCNLTEHNQSHKRRVSLGTPMEQLLGTNTNGTKPVGCFLLLFGNVCLVLAVCLVEGHASAPPIVLGLGPSAQQRRWTSRNDGRGCGCCCGC
jgi:hypothetical protein